MLITGPINVLKRIGLWEMRVTGFLEGEDTFLDLRPVKWNMYPPAGPCFELGEIINLNERDIFMSISQVLPISSDAQRMLHRLSEYPEPLVQRLLDFIEAIPAFNIRDFPDLKEAINRVSGLRIADQLWGFRYHLKRRRD